MAQKIICLQSADKTHLSSLHLGQKIDSKKHDNEYDVFSIDSRCYGSKGKAVIVLWQINKI